LYISFFENRFNLLSRTLPASLCSRHGWPPRMQLRKLISQMQGATVCVRNITNMYAAVSHTRGRTVARHYCKDKRFVTHAKAGYLPSICHFCCIYKLHKFDQNISTRYKFLRLQYYFFYAMQLQTPDLHFMKILWKLFYVYCFNKFYRFSYAYLKFIVRDNYSKLFAKEKFSKIIVPIVI